MSLAPRERPRRLRKTMAVRSLVSETALQVSDLILPAFVVPGRDTVEPVASMPGVRRVSVDRIAEDARDAADRGIRAMLIFGLPTAKDSRGSESHAKDGTVQRAVAAIKDAVPGLVVMTDVCLCSYTDHGHCGLLSGSDPSPAHPGYPEGYILNDETLDVLGQVAVSHAEAGADFVAPSGMFDGMVEAIRQTLDDARYTDVGILSYAVKYASAFYGPFRDAADGAPKHGDRRSHQMDPANAREALREVRLDIREGADLVMVKPALAYLDVIRSCRDRFPETPIVAYNVSGEYAMVKAAAAAGWTDERATVIEVLTGMKRAGADLIISYHALDAAAWLTEDRRSTP